MTRTHKRTNPLAAALLLAACSAVAVAWAAALVGIAVVVFRWVVGA